MTRYDKQSGCLCYICKKGARRSCECWKTEFKTGEQLNLPRIVCIRSKEHVKCTAVRECPKFEEVKV